VFRGNKPIYLCKLGGSSSHLHLQDADAAFESQMSLRVMVLGCLSSWEYCCMTSDRDLYCVKDLRHHHICCLFFVTIRNTKGKLRQREASSK